MTTYNPLNLLTLPPQSLDAKPTPTALAVDPYADILWVGTSSGIVSAYCSPLSLASNIRFPAHGARPLGGSGYIAPGQGPNVKEIRVSDREIWTLAEGGVGGRRRGGAVKWNVSDPTRSLRSMAGNPTNSHEVLAGGTGQMILANTSRGEVVRRMDPPSPVVHLAPLSRNVVSSSLNGQITVLDPRTGFKPAANIVPVRAHTGGLNGADAQGHVVCTWGWTHMSGHPLPDPMVKLYDVRTLRALPPISFPSGPAFCLLHPTDSSKVIISSQTGLLQVIDMSGSTNNQYQQLDVNSYITSMTLSPGGDYLAFGDADGQLHLWTIHETGENASRGEDGGLDLPPFNGYEGIKPEWPDAVDPPASIAWDEKTPLNVIGMPYYSEPLLSNFSPTDYAPITSPFFNPPEPIANSVLNSMKMVDFVGYATMPKDLRGKRYVLTARPGAGKRATGRQHARAGVRRDSGPRFRSEKDRQRQQSLTLDIEEETAPGDIPKYYRKVEIKYSKFGIEDFDFGFYNRTEYSGLETDILNSYTNALLQSLHYTPPVRAIAKAHICVDCKKEHCLLCETGFLSRMLEDAKGINCQASNFSRAFSATPQASALGLMDGGLEMSTAPYGSLIQSFNRWLLSTFSAESMVNGESFRLRQPGMDNLSLEDTTSAIDQVLRIETITTSTCQACDLVSSRASTLHAVDLTYNKKSTEPSLNFAELLRSSLIRETNNKATCSNCKQFVPMYSKRLLASHASKGLPAVMSVNAMVSTPEVFYVWRDVGTGDQRQRFLPAEVSFIPDSEGDLVVGDGDGAVVYEVQSLVVQIQDNADQTAHLVSFAKVPATQDSETSWVMFNDFLVKPVSEEEVFSFPGPWKIPAVIILVRKDVNDILETGNLPTQLEPSALFEDVSIAWNRRKHMVQHTVLASEELPGLGTLISIDAEFVALQQEEMEFKSDGTKSVLRPSHMSLARVSVLRGEGATESVPFIDDYIHTSEVVVDYLTEYSGIKSGDLDPNNSPHTLVPLKVAYKKLRLLVDLGCIFIGHGLSKDFRTINIFVPPEQVMDTVNLYTLPGRQRKLSLRFLSWFLLKKDIQTHTHDSIEDARYALLLYKLYLKFEQDGRFEDLMEDIFYEGQKVGFKPPQDRPPSPSSFPPIRDVASAIAPSAAGLPPLRSVQPTSLSQSKTRSARSTPSKNPPPSRSPAYLPPAPGMRGGPPGQQRPRTGTPSGQPGQVGQLLPPPSWGRPPSPSDATHSNGRRRHY